MKLRLLIDTSVWLDLAKDYHQLPLLDAVAQLINAGNLELILPQTVVNEFKRNKDRVIAESKRSLSSHFRLVRQAIMQFAPEGGREATLAQLNEVDHRVATSGEPVNDAIEIIDDLFASAKRIRLTNRIKARAADRAMARIAPFHREKNNINDAVLIETYVDALARRDAVDDVYGFVTHNIHDFSARGSDTRLPHPDLAQLFDGSGSRYETNLAAVIREFAEDVVEDTRFDREFSQEPRKLYELVEAEHKLFLQVWYNRKWGLIAAHEQGKRKLVSREEWEKAKPEERNKMTVDGIWAGMLESMKRTEEELGPSQIGPWDDFEWGMINGKLSALRWVLGDEWDMLDT